MQHFCGAVFVEDGERFGVVVEEEHVQVAVPVIVEEVGLVTESRRIEAVGSGLFFEDGDTTGVVSFVDEELVGSFGVGKGSGVAKVYIQQVISVDVHEADPCFPGTRTPGQTGNLRHFFKYEIAFVEVERIPAHIGSEAQVDQVVSVDVSRRHTAAIVEVFVHQDVGVQPFFQLIDKPDVGPFGRKESEQCISPVRGFILLTALAEKEQARIEKISDEFLQNIVVMETCIKARGCFESLLSKQPRTDDVF